MGAEPPFHYLVFIISILGRRNSPRGQLISVSQAQILILPGILYNGIVLRRARLTP
jgi:hypothetical protein